MNASILIAYAIALALDIAPIVQGAKPKGVTYFTKAEFINQWPELLEVSHELNQTASKQTAIFVHFKLKEDIGNIHGKFVLKFQHGKTMLNYSADERDICESLHMVNKNYITQMVFVELRRVSNFPLNCPFKQGVDYYVNGFVIDSKVLPSYLPKVAFVAEFKVRNNGRKLIQFNLHGQRH